MLVDLPLVRLELGLVSKVVVGVLNASNTKGRHKKTVFFYFRSQGGRGGLGQSKKFLSENTQIFLTKGGGLTQSKRVLSEKLRFFGIIYQKRGVL